MSPQEAVRVSRTIDVTEIPSGLRNNLPEGTRVRIMQSLGGSYTVVGDHGCMYRVDAKDADALGLSAQAAAVAPAQTEFSEQAMWDQLRLVFDPEIPVNIVDLCLIYGCEVVPLDDGAKRIDVKMTMTAPGCGMGNVLKADVENKLASLPTVKEVRAEVVFEPPWNPSRMSDAAKLQLGFDLDYGT